MLSPTLEQTLRRAFAHATELRHEHVTLEHLLLALTEDQDAVVLMRAHKINVDRMRRELADGMLPGDGSSVGSDGSGARPTAGFTRLLQTAALRAQARRRDATGGDVAEPIFADCARESHTIYWLEEQEASRLDPSSYLIDFARRHEHPLPCPLEKE
jgi:ATP-dependent Clp protease ATP-binding subunit ClpA